MKNQVHVNRPLSIRIESYIEARHKRLFYASLVLMTIFGLALFNLRISEGGDDSTYIGRAMDLLAEGRYPSYQGPLYPMFLAVVISITGFHLAILKLTSLLLLLAGHWLLYRSLKGKVSYTLLFTMLCLTAVNSWYLFFASQTYSEALFILIQNLFVALFVKHICNEKKPTLPNLLLSLSAVSGVVLLAFLCRTAGIGLALAALFSLLALKKYRDSVILIALTSIMLLSWIGIRSAIWPTIPNSGKQLQELMQKHPYDSSEGEETIAGFAGRIVDNSKLYISKHFAKMTGFKKSDSKSTNSFTVVVLYLLFGYGLFAAKKDNPAIFFTGIYLLVMLGITFVSLQKLWDQYRLIIPYLPLMILFAAYSLHKLLSSFAKGRYYTVLLLLIGFSFISTAARSVKSIDSDVLISNMQGNKYEGYTPDWENYLRMSEYIGHNLAENDYVASRKPDMARLYAGGKKFYGIFRFDSEDPDTLLNHLKEKKVTHILLASMRKNPEVNNGEVINTIHRYMAYIAQKYPDIFILQHQIGNSEPAYLFRIEYSRANSSQQNQNSH